jgi:peroxiredoxin (alkyl hydroperoxide reductase subunit C)
MLGIGEKFPEFKLPAVVSIDKGKEFKDISNADTKGKWSVFFFWPMDFTFICPTELAEFNKELNAFRDRETNVYGGSTDSQFVHLAWRTHHADLKHLNYPMLADNKHELSTALGILHNTEKVCLRATYIVDPEGIVRWVSANDLSVGRNVKEIIRTLDGLQSDELCPCNWEKGKPTLKV